MQEVNLIEPFIRSAVLFRWIWNNTRYTLARDARLFYIQSGHATIQLDGQLQDLPTGSAVIFPGGTKYLLQKKGIDELGVISICFDFTFQNCDIAEPFPIYNETNFDPSMILEKEVIKPFDKPLLLKSFLFKRELHEIIAEQKKKLLYYKGKLSAILKCILLDTARMKLSDEMQDSTSAKILDYIAEHFAEKLHNTDLAKKFHFHPQYLSRLIKSATGLPLHSYILNLRIDAAQVLLATTDLSMEEIAFQCGFSSLSTFSAAYRKRTKQCPSFFRSGLH